MRCAALAVRSCRGIFSHDQALPSRSQRIYSVVIGARCARACSSKGSSGTSDASLPKWRKSMNDDEWGERTTCCDCGAEIWPEVDRAFPSSPETYVCFVCAERRG